MSDILLPGRPIETHICVQTREGNDIPNVQFHELSPFELAQAPDLSRRYSGIIVRTAPNPLYNCHGFTFASSRSGVYNDANFTKILHDDGYSEIEQQNQVLPGDIVLYFEYDGSLTHSGLVIESPEPPLFIPKILSKWGKFGEVIHLAHVIPSAYGVNRRYYRITRWT